jgi:hypothetical protein
MGEMRNTKPEWTDNLGNLGIGRRIILKWSLKKQGMNMYIGFFWVRIRSSGRLL